MTYQPEVASSSQPDAREQRNFSPEYQRFYDTWFMKLQIKVMQKMANTLGVTCDDAFVSGVYSVYSGEFDSIFRHEYDVYDPHDSSLENVRALLIAGNTDKAVDRIARLLEQATKEGSH